MVDDFTLFSHQQRLRDPDLMQKYGGYLEGTYNDNWYNFQAFCQKCP